ncbi:uncharacterized [Tachysurus ichikawai]
MAREMERGRPLPASLSLILLGATVEETAAVFPRQGQTPEPERDERRGRRLAVFTAPFCMRNRFGAKQVGAEVSVLMLRLDRKRPARLGSNKACGFAVSVSLKHQPAPFINNQQVRRLRLVLQRGFLASSLLVQSNKSIGFFASRWAVMRSLTGFSPNGNYFILKKK